MNVQMITDFFMWCTIIDAALLILATLMCTCANNFVYSVHSKFFPMPKEDFNKIIYSFLGRFKVLFLIFNLVPYLALLLIA